MLTVWRQCRLTSRTRADRPRGEIQSRPAIATLLTRPERSPQPSHSMEDFTRLCDLSLDCNAAVATASRKPAVCAAKFI